MTGINNVNLVVLMILGFWRIIEISILEKETGNRVETGSNWRVGLLKFNYGESGICY